MKNNQGGCERPELQSFQGLINYSFRNVDLLNEALTHKSFIHEKSREKTCLPVCLGEDAQPLPSRRQADRHQVIPGTTKYNQRLEFLGDALLGMVVSEYLYHRFPQYLEGKLSKMKSLLVNRTILVRKAMEIHLGKYFLLGKGEESAGGRDRASLLADGFEALIGAIYLDGGLSAGRRFILGKLRSELEGLEKEKVGEKDYKSNLQEYTQAEFGQVPLYRVISTQGPSHQRTFEVSVGLKKKAYPVRSKLSEATAAPLVPTSDEINGTGKGETKKSAEQQAAREALEKLRS